MEETSTFTFTSQIVLMRRKEDKTEVCTGVRAFNHGTWYSEWFNVTILS